MLLASAPRSRGQRRPLSAPPRRGAQAGCREAGVRFGASRGGSPRGSPAARADPRPRVCRPHHRLAPRLLSRAVAPGSPAATRGRPGRARDDKESAACTRGRDQTLGPRPFPLPPTETPAGPATRASRASPRWRDIPSPSTGGCLGPADPANVRLAGPKARASGRRRGAGGPRERGARPFHADPRAGHNRACAGTRTARF